MYDETSGYGRALEDRRRRSAEARQRERLPEQVEEQAAEAEQMHEQETERPLQPLRNKLEQGTDSIRPLRDKLEKGTDGIRRSAQNITGYNRRREQENAWKMQFLLVILGVLTAVLIAAVFYEIVLGNGTKQTGQERMSAQKNAAQIIEVYPAETSDDVQEQGTDGAQTEAVQEQDTDDVQTETVQEQDTDGTQTEVAQEQT
jgi:hypothetical protein